MKMGESKAAIGLHDSQQGYMPSGGCVFQGSRKADYSWLFKKVKEHYQEVEKENLLNERKYLHIIYLIMV